MTFLTINQIKKKLIVLKKEPNIKVSKTNDKLSFKFKFELENIPNEIEKEKEISLIKNELKDNNLYISNPERFEEITKN